MLVILLISPLGFSLHQSGTVMKFNTNTNRSISGFSLHQSGTVMKLPHQLKSPRSRFSLHQSGTVMKYGSISFVDS